MNEEKSIKQRLALVDRKYLDIDGVDGIIGFDENYITVLTSAGKINVEGRNLKIDDLSKENGKIHITGEVLGIYYSDETKKSGFSRFFK